jgi:[CysO sulfur-carrier protein]-S-L-cysteine hydrolase
LSTRFRLQIPRDLFQAILDQAAAELPNECCGLLAGRVEGGVGRVSDRFPLPNFAADPGREYESDPKAMFDAVRAVRRDGTDVLAVYHSHPTSDPIPSRTDLDRNYGEGVVNLIISLKTGQPQVKGWWLTAGQFEEAEWDCEG